MPKYRHMRNWIRNFVTSASFRRVVRTGLVAFVMMLVPGLLGWLHQLTEWAESQGQAPFPEPTSLAYLGVAAISAAFVTVGNLVLVMVEDWAGKGILRDPGADM